MKPYPFDAYGIDQYLYAVNDSAWRILNKADRPWVFGTEPVYPLRWYVATGRASAPFMKSMLTIRPDVIARLLLKGGSDQEVMDRIKAKVQKTIS